MSRGFSVRQFGRWQSILVLLGMCVLVISVLFVLQGATPVDETDGTDTSVAHETPPTSVEPIHDSMGGAGTSQDPYVITTDYELQAISHEPDASYRLGNDVNASKTRNWSGTTTKSFGFYNTTTEQVDQFDSIASNYQQISYQDAEGESIVDTANYSVDQTGRLRLSSASVQRAHADTGGEPPIFRYTVQRETGFTPIADGPDSAFTGSFDGDGHTISGLYVNRPTDSQVGLFSQSAGSIKDVTLSDADVTGDESVGILVGNMHSGTVENTTTTGLVQGTATVGGTVGSATDDTVLSNTNATATVRGERQDVGALAGTSAGTVTRSSATGTVTGTEAVGGLVGTLEFNGTVSRSSFSGEVTGGDSVGGVVGYGLGEISDSYSTGSVDGTVRVGGLIGVNNGVEVRSSYTASKVTGESKVGGIHGALGSTTRSYWDVEATGQNSSISGIGLPTSQMQGDTAESMNLDFQSTWQTVDDDYPVLQWQTDKNQRAQPSGPIERIQRVIA